MKHNIAFIHASPAAIPPLMQFYSGAAPDLQITNLLDDGLLRLFAAGSFEVAESRLREMLATARDVYAAELAMLTCSAVPRPVLDRLRALARIPVLKIDEPMARRAVAMGKRIAISTAVTFLVASLLLTPSADPFSALTIGLVAALLCGIPLLVLARFPFMKSASPSVHMLVAALVCLLASLLARLLLVWS